MKVVPILGLELFMKKLMFFFIFFYIVALIDFSFFGEGSRGVIEQSVFDRGDKHELEIIFVEFEIVLETPAGFFPVRDFF